MIHFTSLFRQTSLWQTTRRQNDQRYLESPSEQPRIRWNANDNARDLQWTTTMCQISKTKCFKQNRPNHERSCWWRKRKLKRYYGKFQSFIPFDLFLNTVHFYTFRLPNLSYFPIFLKLYFRMQWAHLSLNTWDNVLRQAINGQFVSRISPTFAKCIAQNKIFWTFFLGLWSLPKTVSIEIDASNKYSF